jgi:hypothetical protein
MASSKRRSDTGATTPGTVQAGVIRGLSSIARVPRGSSAAGSAKLKAEITEIAERDYGKALRQCLSRWEIREIAEEGKTRVWPGLNQQPVTLVSPHEFVRRWSSFGVDFKFASLPQKGGLSLLGFYVEKIDQVRRRPMIFVNTAHPPAVVGVALDHEMGHHLTTEIFGASERVHLLSQSGFDEHLTEPSELAADTLVSLGMLPAPIARKIFRNANRAESDNQSLIVSGSAYDKQLLEYLATRYGFRLDQFRGTKQRFQALAGYVHYTKLRRALLDEYDI